ncbi:hypothetical protein C2E23DRAFT_18936 [Lenzites betulinus]|nr:hypothetical protein C2E23DRAFT_18936 [Lenzites betulinus]
MGYELCTVRTRSGNDFECQLPDAYERPIHPCRAMTTRASRHAHTLLCIRQLTEHRTHLLLRANMHQGALFSQRPSANGPDRVKNSRRCERRMQVPTYIDATSSESTPFAIPSPALVDQDRPRHLCRPPPPNTPGRSAEGRSDNSGATAGTSLNARTSHDAVVSPRADSSLRYLGIRPELSLLPQVHRPSGSRALLSCSHGLRPSSV